MSAYNVVLGVAQSNQRVPHARTRRRRRRLRRSPSPPGAALSRTAVRRRSGSRHGYAGTDVRLSDGCAHNCEHCTLRTPLRLEHDANMLQNTNDTYTHGRIETKPLNETHAAVKTRASFVT